MAEPTRRQFDDNKSRAISDAKKDSKGVFGRQHGSSWMFPQHHTSQEYHASCGACKTDAEKGVHPKAVK